MPIQAEAIRLALSERLALLWQILVSAFCMAFTALIARRAPGDCRAASLSWLSWSLAALATGQVSSAQRLLERVQDPPHDPLSLSWLSAAAVFTMGGVLVLPFLMHMISIFPRRRGRLSAHPAAVALVYLLPIDLLAVGLGAGTAAWAAEADSILFFLGTLLALGSAALLTFVVRCRVPPRRGSLLRASLEQPGAVLLASTFLSFAWGLRSPAVALTSLAVLGLLVYPSAAVAGVRAAWRESSAEERRQLCWPLGGTAASLALLLLAPWFRSAFALTFRQELEFSVGFGDLAFLLLVPGAFALGILKHRLLDIDALVRKSTAFVLALAALFGAYCGLVILLGVAASQVFAIESRVGTILLTLGVGAMFVPVRDRVRALLERTIFRSRVEHAKALDTVSREIRRARGVRALAAAVADRVQSVLRSESVGVFLYQLGGSSLRCVGALNLPHSRSVGRALEALPEAERRALESPGSDLPAALAELGLASAARIAEGDEQLGFLVVGPRRDGRRPDEDDLGFVHGAAARVAAALGEVRLRAFVAASAKWSALGRSSRELVLVLARSESDVGVDWIGREEILRRIAAESEGERSSLDRDLAGLVDAGIVERNEAGELRLRDEALLELPEVLTGSLEPPSGPAGDLVGGYRLGARLGAGGMGEIFRATSLRDGSPAAVKLLRTGAQFDRWARRRFEREGGILADLRHPNIVRVFARGEDGGRFFVAMELIDGTTLAEQLEGGALPGGEVGRLALELASALAAIHRAGVVHRDVKPSNVMVTRSGRLVLLDFGLARGADAASLTRRDQILGTLPYMAPEQLRGERATAAADVWSFGIVLYEMSVGRLPWRSSEPVRLSLEILAAAPDLRAVAERWGEDLCALLADLVAALPGERPRDGGAVLERLRALALPEPWLWSREPRPPVDREAETLLDLESVVGRVR